MTPSRQNTLDLIKWLKKLVTQITWLELLIDVRKHKCGKSHKEELFDKEVQYMLKNDIIEESQSNWSSSCILVPKHDGGFRFCTNFSRKTNDKTRPKPRYSHR